MKRLTIFLCAAVLLIASTAVGCAPKTNTPTVTTTENAVTTTTTREDVTTTHEDVTTTKGENGIVTEGDAITTTVRLTGPDTIYTTTTKRPVTDHANGTQGTTVTTSKEIPAEPSAQQPLPTDKEEEVTVKPSAKKTTTTTNKTTNKTTKQTTVATTEEQAPVPTVPQEDADNFGSFEDLLGNNDNLAEDIFPPLS